MKNNILKRHSIKGFTLVEVLVCVAIFSIISVGIFNLLIIGQRTFYSGLGTIELQAEIRRGIYWIARELRETTGYTITTVSANDDSVIFSTPTKSSISYYRDVSDLNSDGVTNQIIREYPAGTRTVVATDVTSLKFTPSSNMIVIDFILSKLSGNKQLTLNSKAKVEVRNE